MNELPRDVLETTAEPMLGESLPVVPDLMGLGLEQACESAAWAGARISATSVRRVHAPWGIVVAQSPAPGTRIKGRWQIHVLVSVPPAEDGPRDA